MADRLSRKEKKLIEELHEQGLDPVEIAKEMSQMPKLKRRDTRTVKHYLNKLPTLLSIKCVPS